MIITIFSLGLLILFCYSFIAVLRNYRNELARSSKAAVAEKALAARFIKNAMAQYSARHRSPCMSALLEMETLLAESDELVEQYLQFLKSNNSTANSRISMLPLVKKAL